jgi:hypothetical protein
MYYRFALVGNGTKGGRSKEDVCFARTIQVVTIHEEKLYR